MTAALTSEVDLYDDATILDPYPAYCALRDLGSLVALQRYGIYALPRYEGSLALASAG